MYSSIRMRRSSGTGVVAGSGTTAGSLSRSTASSQPGTREPCSKRLTSAPRFPARVLTVDPSQYRIEHGQRGDEVGDVDVLAHRPRGLEVHEARVAHVHARGLARAVGAHEAAELATRRLDGEVDLAGR